MHDTRINCMCVKNFSLNTVIIIFKRTSLYIYFIRDNSYI